MMINYFVDFSETTISVAASSGDSVVTVGDASFIYVSHSIYIGAELHTIVSIDGNNITIAGTLAGAAAVDTVVVIDDSTHDALTLLTAKRSIFGWTPSLSDETNIWVRRKTLSLTVSPTFSGISSSTYISWPIPGDDHYSDRPQEGIDAGWDSDSVENAKMELDATGIYFKLRACTIHKIDFIDVTTFLDDPSDTISMFENTNQYMNFEKCNISGYRLFNSPNQNTYYHYYNFTDCDITLEERIVSFTYTSYSRDMYLPYFIRCNLHFKSGTTYSIAYVYRTYSPQMCKMVFNFIDCHLYYESDIYALICSQHSYSNAYSGDKGTRSSTIELTLHSDGFNINYFHVYMQSLYNSNIKITGVGDGSYIQRLIHFQTTDSSKNILKNSTITIDSAVVKKVFDNNYGLEGYLNIDIKDSEIDYIFVDSQRELSSCFLNVENSKIIKLVTASSTVVKNIEKTGDTDFFIYARYGNLHVFNSDLSAGTVSDSIITTSSGGSCNVYDSFLSAGDNLISQSSSGGVSIFNASPFAMIERKGTFQSKIDTAYRIGSTIESSILIESVGSLTYGVYSIGDGETYGIKAQINEGDSVIEAYLAWTGEGIPSSIDISAVSFFSDYALADFSIVEDSSVWTPDISSEYTTFKVLINIPPGVDAGIVSVRFNFIGRGTRYNYFIDPALISV